MEVPTLEPPVESAQTTVSPRRMRGVPRGLIVVSELGWRLLVVAAAIVLVGWALWQVRLVALPLLVAVLLSTLLFPPAQRLRRAGLPNALATTIVFLVALGVMVAAFWLIVPPVVQELSNLAASIRAGIDQLADLLATSGLGISQGEAQGAIREAQQTLTSSVDAIFAGVLNGAVLITEFLAGTFIALVVVFFFIKDGSALWAWVARLFPERAQDTVMAVGHSAWHALGTYVRGIVLVATFDAVFIGLALAIIGVPLVLPLSVLVFLAAFVPFVGAIAAGAVAALVALVTEGVFAALAVVIAITVVQQIEGNILYPLVVGRSTHLHPVGILIAVTTGAVLAGIIGAVVAVPILAVVGTAVPIIRSAAETTSRPRPELPEGSEAGRSGPPPPG
ncbi:MAG TPA: AI-2E family transporter [Solirubrobacteraceae bacterium]|nr:AI-2E family transporter [Solirubrobacteraceae bacterium]